MPTYRYYTVPILEEHGTQAVVELELSGVTMDRQIGGPGNFQGTYRMGHQDDQPILLGTVPGYYALVCKRDGIPIWAGPIWSRTYESQGQTLQFTAQTYESIFARLPAQSISHIATAFGTVINDWLSDLNALSTPGDFGIDYLAPTWFGGSEPSVTIKGLDGLGQTSDTFLNDMCAFIQGDYMINIGAGTGDAITKQITFTGSGAEIVQPELPDYFEYPGTLSAYWYPESSVNGGLLHYAKVGNVVEDANSVIDSTRYVARGYPDTGWPLWVEVTSWSSLVNIYGVSAALTAQQLLQSMANWQATNKRLPNGAMTIELTDGVDFARWNDLNSYINVQVDDARWPGGFPGNARKNQIILGGWSLAPESSETSEVIRLAERESF